MIQRETVKTHGQPTKTIHVLHYYKIITRKRYLFKKMENEMMCSCPKYLATASFIPGPK